MNIQINYASEEFINSFRSTLAHVASERLYIEMIEAPPLEEVIHFQKKLISSNAPVFYATLENQVIGWCDISISKNPRLSHRGGLGMGLLPKYRGHGLGSQLLHKTLEHAKLIGLEKVELHVYTTNTSAIALYKKHGFEQEGFIKKFRKLDGQYFDCLAMGKFL